MRFQWVRWRLLETPSEAALFKYSAMGETSDGIPGLNARETYLTQYER